MTTHRSARWAALAALLLAAPAPGLGPPLAVPRGALQSAPPAVPRAGLPTPSVSIRVRVPAESAPGQEITYRISVENASEADAHHVTARVPLPATATFLRSDPEPSDKGKALLWKYGTLAPGTRKHITLVLKPSGTEEVRVCAYVQFEHGQCVRTRIREKPKRTLPFPKPEEKEKEKAGALSLKKTGPAEAARYDSITYRLEVRNTGQAALRDVVVEERLPAGLEFLNSKPAAKGTEVLTWELGELGPGKSQIIEYQAAARDTGTLENKAVARAAGGLRRESAFKTRVRLPRVEASVSWPAIRAVGRDFTYRITVSNPDTLPLKGVQVSDDLAREEDITFLSATAGGTLVGRNVEWDLGDLRPGESKSVEVTLKARRAGTFKNVVTVTETRGVKEQVVSITDLTAAGTLALEATAGRAALAVGQQAALTLRVVNTGKAVEKNLRVTVTLPEGLQALDARGARIPRRAVALQPLPPLKPGEQKDATLRVVATRAGAQRLAVELHGGAAAVRGVMDFDVRGAN